MAKRLRGKPAKRQRGKRNQVAKRQRDERFVLSMSNLPASEPMEFDLDTFVTLGRFTFLNSAIVPVLVDDGTQIRCLGSAFNISPDGLWVTARHVIDFALELVGNNPEAHTYVPHVFLLWVEPWEAEQVAHGEGEQVPHPHRGAAFVPVTYFTKDNENFSDLALLRAGMLKDNVRHEFPICRLSARVPKTGTHLTAMGYSQFTVSADTTTENLREIAFKHNFSVSTGRVLEVYREGRDTFRDLDGRYTGTLPTVCFETSARFEPGMSGGPVMDEDGAICGIVSTGLESDESSSDRSFASATPLLFTLAVPHHEGDDPLTVYQLAQGGAVNCDGYFERLIITEQDGQQSLIYPCEDEDG
jgi:hypothetical protein